VSQKLVWSAQQEVCRLEYYARLNHCVIERGKKKKKEHTQNIPKEQTPASKSIFYSTIKDNMKMLIWFQAYTRIAANKTRNFFQSLRMKTLILLFLSCRRSWEIFMSTTIAIHIRAMQILIILKVWSHRMLIRKKKCPILQPLASISQSSLSITESSWALRHKQLFQMCLNRISPLPWNI